MAAQAQSPEQRELSLIGKVEMRIALADSDNKLESTLKTYLSPLLLKLASEHQSVRNKVISVCQHINTRVKPQSIQLPVPALVKQFKDQDNSLIRHFDLLYIQQGVGRLTNAERASLLPIVVKGISDSGSHGSQIFHLLLQLLEAFPLPLRGSKEDVELRDRMEISSDDAQYLASWIGKLLLLTPQKTTKNPSCPGLAQSDYEFLTLQGKDDVWSPNAGGMNLQRTKILAAKLLASGLFKDSERFLPALFASADSASTISDVGEDILKRALPATDLEDERLVSQLYELYFGTKDVIRCRVPLRLKILGLLNKSTLSTTFAHRIMDLVDDGMASPTMDGDDVVMGNAPATNSSIGREATKLRSTIFTYINFVARYGSHETLHAIAARIVSRLRDFVENQGWPRPGNLEDLVSRGYAYEVIGLLAKAGPRDVLVENDRPTLDLLRWLFDSLAKDSSGNSITVSIEEALSTVLSAMSTFTLAPAEQSSLEDLLIDQMELSSDLETNKRLRSTRYVAVRFANRCLPYASVKARWVDVMGCGATSDRSEVKEEAERGLSPYWYRMLNGTIGGVNEHELTFPSFDDVLQQFFAGRTINASVEPAAVAKQAQKSYPSFYRELSGFTRRVLYQEAMLEAAVAVKIDSEWERRIDAAVESDIKVREAIKKYLSGPARKQNRNLDVLQFALLEDVIEKSTLVENHLVEFLALAPDTTVAKLVPHTSELIPILQANHFNRRIAAARSFGILASHPAADTEQIDLHVHQLLATSQRWKSAVGAVTSQVHGAIVALGYYFSRAAYRGNIAAASSDRRAAFAELILSVLSDSRDELLKEASWTALGQLCMFNAVTVATIEESKGLRQVIDRLYDSAKSGAEPAILCMGELSMILPEDSEKEEGDQTYLLEQLYKLHEIRQTEAHFVVGEALSYVATGWRSEALATKLDINGSLPQGPTRRLTLGKLVDRIVTDSANTKPALKKATVMWLLCLVQFCGGEPEVQQRLSKCQNTFKRCLSDRDELVQETASRGLGLVYEKGDRGLKDDLVRDLVSSFSSDRQSQLAGNVSADTQLFEPGALPTGDGSVSTYKDIMSLASEVGDSSLVYRFMSMASSNAIWSSRAAFGRFGLSSVLSDSSVDGYLADNPKLYPKLFRYRFDPNGGVQRSMNEIWNALVKDSSATIDKHFDAIMQDLLTSILGKEWRVRQASCAAIADLVSGRPLEKYDQYLEQIWTQCFKVLDDIKESVRAAAASLARTLTGVLTRTLEADHSSTRNAAAMLKHVLPFLLSPSGMESSAKEVQAFAVHTLLEIIKKSNGTTLRPFIPELVERLIGLLSSLEPEAVNYIHLNASKYNLTEQKIDDMRLSSVRSSPLMEAVERCLDLLDDETMRVLKPRLDNAMKSAVGLPSKVGSSRILVSLSTRRMVLFKPYSDDALRLVEKLVLDRNETVSSSYAAAAGYIARGASDKQILRMIDFTKSLYFQSEGDREATVPRKAIAAGEMLYALSKHASDRFNGLAASALPFVFVAKHDPNDTVKEQFQNTWNESVGGSRAVGLYLPEILSLAVAYLDSPQWTLKHTSARAVANATVAVCSAETRISERIGEQLWPAIDKALSGKTWDGKEVVLGAFVKFVETASDFYSTRADVKSTILKVSAREAKRQNAAYRSHAIKAIGQVALAIQDVDMFGTIHDILSPLLTGPLGSQEADVDKEERTSDNSTSEAILAASITSLFGALNPSVLHGEDLDNAINQAVTTVAQLPFRSQLRRSIYEALLKLFDRIDATDPRAKIHIDAGTLKILLFGLPDESIALRTLRADALIAMSRVDPNLTTTILRGDIEALMTKERESAIRDRLSSVFAA